MDEFNEQIKKELEHYNFDLRRYRRWIQEKRDFGYFPEYTEGQIESFIEDCEDQIEKLNKVLEAE